MSVEETVAGYIREYTKPDTIQIKLDKNRVNYILIHFGSFNPPHVGHLDFLKHTVENCGNDLSIVCALLAPRDDNFVGHKFLRTETDPLVLPQELRGKLCYADERWPKWAGILGPQRDHGWIDRFHLQELQQRAAQLGVRLNYLALRGIETDLRLRWYDLSPDPAIYMILVNTYGRQGGDSLASWDMESKTWQHLHQRGADVQLFQALLKSGKSRSAVGGFGYVRVIRASNPYVSDISSTKIRTLARQCSADTLTHHESMDVVLSWGLLRDHAVWKQWHSRQLASLGH